ncbi:MAG: Zn-dependent hydrolase, partial [Anaerolineae bacterium]|nr:Zn-dependent hydrolase [Anaerolineae bacterium]
MIEPDNLIVDGEQLLEDLQTLNQFGAEPGPGLNRVAFSEADQAGRRWLETQMQSCGLSQVTDPAGTSIGTYPGTEPGLAPIALGSHTDTVPNGGRYDGALGVLAALACVRTLHQARYRLRHPVEVINFVAEEATMGGATIGSRAMAGTLPPETIEHLAWDGLPVAAHLSAAGLDPARITQAKRPSGAISAFLELHIEQGARLEQAGTPIGVVEGIVGIRRYSVSFEGQANHAGTTPMTLRQDALVMAAPFILAVPEIAIAHNIVGTIGVFRIEPGAPNIIPGNAYLEFEIRGLDEVVLDQAEAVLARQAREYGGQFKQLSVKPSVTSDERLVAAIITA